MQHYLRFARVLAMGSTSVATLYACSPPPLPNDDDVVAHADGSPGSDGTLDSAGDANIADALVAMDAIGNNADAAAQGDGQCQCPPIFVPPSARSSYCQPGTDAWIDLNCGGEVVGPLAPPDLAS